MIDLHCSSCGVVCNYDESAVQHDLYRSFVWCNNCGGQIDLPRESVVYPISDMGQVLPPLDPGDIVRITNREHPWFEDIGIIRQKKFKHYRVEVHGQLVWLPEDWVAYNEFNDTY